MVNKNHSHFNSRPSSAWCTLIMLAGCLPFLAGCAARFQPSDEAAPHAVLAVPSQEAQWESRMFFDPLEFNGLAHPRNRLRESFRIPPGEFRLLTRVAHESLQGTCLLEFTAFVGATYRLHARLIENVFTIEALNDGQVVASCNAAATVLPTPARIPGVPAR
jgi:hypothetical protein